MLMESGIFPSTSSGGEYSGQTSSRLKYTFDPGPVCRQLRWMSRKVTSLLDMGHDEEKEKYV